MAFTRNLNDEGFHDLWQFVPDIVGAIKPKVMECIGHAVLLMK